LIYGSGYNSYYNLGDGTTTARTLVFSNANSVPNAPITFITGTRQVSVALNSIGEAYSWGNGANGGKDEKFCFSHL
jgi:hypothetical protein